LDTFKKILPSYLDVFQVLAAALFVVHSWSLRAFFYKVPSFQLYMNIGQIGSVFAYMMAYAFLESLVLTAGLVVVSMLLPGKWYRKGFCYKGFVTIFVGAISAILLQNSISNQYMGMNALLKWGLVTLAVIIILNGLAHFLSPVRRGLTFLVEQISVMFYLFMPIGFISLLVVAWRILS